MIAKGNLHGDGGKLAQYLIIGDGNEIAELVEVRGLEYLGRDPIEAFEMLQKVAEANTQSTKPFFHAQTRNRSSEHLTNEQWLQIADREEKRLGFDGQPRIVSFHIFPNGEKHLHVGWFRIDLETMRAIDPGLFKNHLKQLCRTLEKEYGLQEVSNVRKPEDIARIGDRKEVEEARRLGMDDRAIRNTIVDCLQRTDGGKAFNAALDERGLTLANGDKRDCFVVIDQAGGHHALNKKLTGLTLAAMRDRLSDLDRSQLPSVDQAKAMQQEKYPTPEKAREDWDRRVEGAQPEPAVAATAPEKEPQKEPPRSKAAADIHATWSQSPHPNAFVSAMHDQGYRMARVSPEEARDSERVAAFAKELGNRAPRYREGEIVAVNDRGWTYRLNENSTGAERIDILKFAAALKDRDFPSMGEARALQIAEHSKVQPTEPWHGRPVQKTEQTISRIQEAADRGGISVSAGLQAEGLTLARVDAAGRASAERENLRQYENDRLQGKTDARRRQAPNVGELVAVNRYGDVFRLNPRFVETDRLERDATGGRDKTPTLSQAQQHFATARQERRDLRDDRAAKWDVIRETNAAIRNRDRVADAIKRTVPETVSKFGKAAFKVAEGARVFGSIASFFESAFGLDGNARPDHQQQQQAPQGRGGGDAEQLWEEIYEAVQKGQSIQADTLRHMPAAELENLRSNGDAVIAAKIMDMQREKADRAAQEWHEYDHDRMGRER